MDQLYIKGLDLSQVFYREGVRPVLATRFPGLVYSAALIGPGSEVLGMDTPQSMDHSWGPRLQLFLAEADYSALHDTIDLRLREELPREIRGFPTRFRRHDDGTTVMVRGNGGLIDHGVEIHTVRRYYSAILGFDPTAEITAAGWVSVTGHDLLMLTAGRVFHDGLGTLRTLREKLRYYPHDVWLYLLAAQWARIGQEEAFPGRCAQVGDNLGSRLIASRLVCDLMRLCFLMERTYAPYIKWFGTAFAQLSCAVDLLPILTRVVAADNWEGRETHLTAAYAYVARMHNSLSITQPLAPHVSWFHNRPFQIIHADRFAGAIRAEIGDAEVLALPENLGAIDQFIDSTDALNYVDRLRVVYAG